MGPPPWQRDMPAARPRTARLCLLGALVAGLAAPNAGAVRMEGLVAGAGASRDVSVAAAGAAAPQTEVEKELSLAGKYVDVINVEDETLTLSNVRDILYNLERLKSNLQKVGPFRETRTRLSARRIQNHIRTKSEALTALAAKKEAEGELDDGGDVPASQRDNICKTIDQLEVCDDFRVGVKRLCEALDKVRTATLAGEDISVPVHQVNGWLDDVRTQKDYALHNVSWGIACVMGEERRWVSRRLESRPADFGAAPAGGGNVWAEMLQSWLDDAAAYGEKDGSLQLKRFSHALSIVRSFDVEEEHSLSDVRTFIHRLQLCSEMVAECIVSCPDHLRDQIREVLGMIKDRSELMEELATAKEKMGEVDDVLEVPPTKRNNVCKNIDAYDIEAYVRQELKQICTILDRVREAARAGVDTDMISMEVVGRLSALKRRPGYEDLDVAGEMELILAEEHRWLRVFEKGLVK